jgi:tetratricopeptide (TPR) repeat protein
MDRTELEEAILIAYKHRKSEQVRTLSEEAVSTYPNKAFGYSYLAKAALLEQPILIEEAASYLTIACDIEPQNINYIAQFARFKNRLGKTDEAQLLWAKVVAIDPSNLEALTARAHYFLKNKSDYRQAIELLNQIIQYYSAHKESYWDRATAYFKLEEYEKALEDYNQFVELNDGIEHEELLMFKVSILRSMNQQADTIDAYQALSRLVPNNYNYPLQAAYLLDELERYQEAAEYYEQAINCIDTINKDHANILLFWGTALYKTKQYQKAIKAFDMHIKYSDNPIVSLLKQVDSYLELGANQKALETIVIAKSRNIDELKEQELNKLKADILVKLQRYNEAVETLYKLVEKDNLYRNESMFLLGKIFFSDKQMKTAYHYLRLASLYGEQQASNFLNKHFKDYIFSLQETFYQENKSTAKSNAKASFVKKIQGKVWRFSRLKNIDASTAPENIDKKTEAKNELMDELQAEMEEVGFLYLTNVAFFLVIPESAGFYAYSRTKSSAREMVIDTQSIDGLLKGETTLRLTKEGLLDYSITGNESKAILFKEVTLDEISEPLKIRVRQVTERRNFELIGDKNTKALTNVIWS